MTSRKKTSDPVKGRKEKFEKLTNKAKSGLGNLDFIDDLPESPEPKAITFPMVAMENHAPSVGIVSKSSRFKVLVRANFPA